jgi:hypothetical protein
MGRRSAASALLASGIGAIGVGLIGLVDAACFGAGGALALMLLAGGSQRRPDALYPARLQLARFRRSGKSAHVLVVKLPPRGASRRCASAVSSVLRITDGVAKVPSLGGTGLCAVLEADTHAKNAIQQRLANACGDEIRMGWASSPDDGVTLESLIAAAVDRVPEARRPRRRHSLRPLPVQRLIPRSLGPDREPMRSGR